jgi:hypothetical protein
MEPESSLPCSQQPNTGPYPEPGESSTPSHITFNILIKFIQNMLLRLPKCVFHSGFQTKILYSFLISLKRSIFPVILFDLIILIFGDEYKSWSSSTCSLLHFPDASSLSDPNVALVIQGQRSRQCKKYEFRYEFQLLSVKKWRWWVFTVIKGR